MDIEKTMSWLEGLSQDDWREFHSDSEVQNIAKSALELLKEQQKEIKRIRRLSNEIARVALHHD